MDGSLPVLAVLGGIAMLVAAASVWAVRRGDDPATDPVAVPEQQPALTPQRLAGWDNSANVVAWLQSVHAQNLMAQAAQSNREREGAIRRAYLRGFDDATSGRPNKYMDIRYHLNPRDLEPVELIPDPEGRFYHRETLVEGHREWCGIFLSADRGGGLCNCHRHQ